MSAHLTCKLCSLGQNSVQIKSTKLWQAWAQPLQEPIRLSSVCLPMKAQSEQHQCHQNGDNLIQILIFLGPAQIKHPLRGN